MTRGHSPPPGPLAVLEIRPAMTCGSKAAEALENDFQVFVQHTQSDI